MINKYIFADLEIKASFKEGKMGRTKKKNSWYLYIYYY